MTCVIRKNTQIVFPPTPDGLKHHKSRAHYQTTICLKVIAPSLERIDPKTWGCRARLLKQPIETKAVAARTYTLIMYRVVAVAKYLQQDGVTVDQIISYVFGLSSVDDLLNVAE